MSAGATRRSEDDSSEPGDVGMARHAAPAARAEARRHGRADAIIMGIFVVAAFAVTGELWRNPTGRYLSSSVADQYGFEWVIATVTHALLHFENPLFTDNLNAPFGVNLMAQTSIIGLTVPLMPVTLLFGPAATFLVLVTGSLAGTACAWYWVLSRHLVRSPVSAAIAGVLCGFAPPMIAHASGGHVNYIALFLLPFVAWRAVMLRMCGRWARNGLILGLLVAWQVLIGEEPLLVAAVGFGTFAVVYAAMNRAEVATYIRHYLAGLGVAAATAVAIVGYPLWFQFMGPQSYGAIPHAASIGNNLFSLTTFASRSIGGMHPVGYMASNPTEENGFFGWPLLALTTVAAIWLWRRSVLARAAAVTATVLLVLSLGVELAVLEYQTGIPLPWRLVTEVPLVGSIPPARLTFAAIPAIAVVLALATDRIISLGAEIERSGVPIRLLWLGAVAAVLLPIAPTRLDAHERPGAPAVFSSGAWRDYAAPGRTIVAVPPPGGGSNHQVRWQIAAGMEFSHIEGYFIGPHGPDGHGWYGVADPRPTSKLFTTVSETGTAVRVSDEQRQSALEDLRFWRADAVALDPSAANSAALRQTIDDLLGPGTLVQGMWIWDVRKLVGE